MIIDKVNWPEDVKKLTIKEKEELAEELREKTIDVVSKTGGHLASNLGVVELTIALHSCFNMPQDKIVWDVGHQTYIHKMLTGRKGKFDTLMELLVSQEQRNLNMIVLIQDIVVHLFLLHLEWLVQEMFWEKNIKLLQLLEMVQ